MSAERIISLRSVIQSSIDLSKRMFPNGKLIEKLVLIKRERGQEGRSNREVKKLSAGNGSNRLLFGGRTYYMVFCSLLRMFLTLSINL